MSFALRTKCVTSVQAFSPTLSKAAQRRSIDHQRATHRDANKEKSLAVHRENLSALGINSRKASIETLWRRYNAKTLGLRLHVGQTSTFVFLALNRIDFLRRILVRPWAWLEGLRREGLRKGELSRYVSLMALHWHRERDIGGQPLQKGITRANSIDYNCRGTPPS